MTVKFNTTQATPVGNFLSGYKVWCDAKNFYETPHQPLAELDLSGIPEFHYRDISKINASDADIIAINCVTEGLHSYEYFNQYDKNKHYIIFANGSWGETSKIKIEYTLITHKFFLFLACEQYIPGFRLGACIDTTYQFDYPKPYNFISLIGFKRAERTYLVNNLLETTSNKNYILRYSGQDLAVDSTALDVVNFTKNKFDSYTTIESLDSDYHHSVSNTIPIKMYNSAYFNLVVETDIIYDNNFFVTEKTTKCLITGIPFVIVSTANFLKGLKQLGFQTYNELWDESYDDEIDYKKRIDKILHLVKSLETFDWAKHKNKLIEISNNNKLMFLKMNTIMDTEFYNFEKQITKFL